ncbi:MAG: flagellar basal body-associated FliL family protein [Chloroflexota bacterium]
MKLGKKAILGIGLPLGLGLAGGLLYVFVLSGPSVPPEIPDPVEGQHGVMLAMPDQVINMLTGGAYRYEKVGVTIEIRPESADFYKLGAVERKPKEEEAIKKFEPALPLLTDAVGSVVGAKSSDELGTPEGRKALKDELLTRVKEILGSKEVLNIYFTSLVMQ